MTPDHVTLKGSSIASGEVSVSGFKHAMVSTIACAVALRGEISLSNVPEILETDRMCRLLDGLGATVRLDNTGLYLDCSSMRGIEPDAAYAAEIHGSLYLFPALLCANGAARLGASGGCQIGSLPGGGRPVEHVVDVMRRFGSDIAWDQHGLTGRLLAVEPAHLDIAEYSSYPEVISGPYVSGATKVALIAAGAAAVQGVSTISNPYRKPDVIAPIHYFRRAGISVTDDGNRLAIGPAAGPPNAVKMRLTADVSEIMTYIVLAVMCGISLDIRGVDTIALNAGLAAEFSLLDRMGVVIELQNECLRVAPPKQLRSIDIEVTSQSIYSDHQPLFALLLLRGNRPARITERVWTTRFSYAGELSKLGAKFESRPGAIIVHPSKLKAPQEPLCAGDLRSAACLLIAGLSTRQQFQLSGAAHLDRGYSQLWDKLCDLGTEVTRD